MTSTVYLILDERRKKADGTYPIVFRIIHKRKHTTIASGYSALNKDWDYKKSRVKQSCKNIADVTTLNSLLKQKEAEYNSLIIDFRKKGILDSFGIRDLKKHIHKQPTTVLLFSEYAEQIIEDLKSKNKFGSADIYKYTLRFIHNYYGKDLLFTEIDKKVLDTMESRYLFVEKNKINGLSVYMRTIRTVFNRAIADGAIESTCYPFKRSTFDKNKYTIKNERTRKRAVSKEFIRRIESFDIEPDTEMWNAKNYFLFSFYMRGLNFTDQAFIKKKNIQNNQLIYKRAKTHRQVEVFLNEKAYKILVLYGFESKSPDDFLFPIIRRHINLKLSKKDISNQRATTNKYLKRIAKLLNTDVNLTTYVSRHSWATIADKAGIDRRIISKGLGHNDLKTTEIYIDDIVSEESLIEADLKIIN